MTANLKYLLTYYRSSLASLIN